MKRSLMILLMAGILVLGIGFEVLAQEELMEKELTEEELLFMEIPVVFASSKRLQPITEAVSSIEIITAEEIKRSGAITIADVLRSVAGIHVKEPSVSSHAVGIRGLPYTQNVLVTLNGDSTYLHHCNHIYFDFIPIDLEEIERIEIVRGPGAVFYGGAAFSGVINIVTKTPKQIDGTQVNMVGGNWDTLRGNIIQGGSYKKVDYSLILGYRQSEYMSPPRASFMKTHTQSSHFAGRVIYNLDEESSISTAVRYGYTDEAMSRMCTPKNTYVSLRHDRANSWMRFFYNNQYKECFEEAIGVDDTDYEFEVMHTLIWGKNITSIGGFARRVYFTAHDLINDVQYKNDIEDYAIKAENEYSLTDKLILTFGGRFEYFSELEFVVSGRGGVIFKPIEDQSIHLRVGNGYYLPSVTQLYGGGDAIPLFLANPSLKEEKITSYELSYYGRPYKKIKLNTSIFYNEYKDLIANRDGIAPPKNEIDAHQHGLELSFDFMFTKWLTSFLNYTYMSMHRNDFPDLDIDPKNMFNLGLHTKFAKWSTNLIFHYVDHYYEIYDHANPVLGLLPEPQKVDSYYTIDARIAYIPRDNLEVAIAAANLLDNKHYESNPTGLVGADDVRRRITASVSCKF